MHVSMGRHRAAAAALALLAAGVLSPGPTATAASTGARSQLPDSMPALPAGTRAVGAAPAGAAVDAIVYLRPRNPALLERTALAASGRRPLSPAAIRRLFLPSPATVSLVRDYLLGEGLTVTGGADTAIEVRGTAAAAERAFGIQLELYRTPAGSLFRAPAGAVSLPGPVATAVRAVGGLQTGLALHAAATRAARSHLVTPTCAAAGAAQQAFGGYLPDQLATAYGLDALQGAPNGDLGSGETIGLVEFSGYSPADIATYENCFPAGTFTGSLTNAPVNGGSGNMLGQLEAELDIEVAASAAPASQVRVYEAPNDLAEVPLVIDAMRIGGVNVASDSWGLCEPLVGASLLAAESDSLQLAAVAGMSFYAASGDGGASDCRAVTGALTPAVDDPSSQPFATGVGGTILQSYTAGSPPTRHESAWHSDGGASGGGVSAMWTRPGWQSGVTALPGRCTASPSIPCREVPDVSMDAAPSTGYLVYCNGCGQPLWAPVGGTSGGAPLLAAITADANQYSLGHGGSRLGYANPFLYAEATADPRMFGDVTHGNNNVGGGGYSAGPGFDAVTGIGSVNAMRLATDLASFTPSTPAVGSSTITVDTAPASGSVVADPRRITFSGTLTGGSGNAPVASAPVHLVSSYGSSYRATTGSGADAGDWTISVRPVRNATWTLVYTGSSQLSSTSTAGFVVLVRPSLSAVARLPRSAGVYRARAGRRFTVSGWSGPNMHGAAVLLQRRRAGGRAWGIVRTVAVGRLGGYRAAVALPAGLRYDFRWVHQGGSASHWMTGFSVTIAVLAGP